jgi:hypothetical protein
MDYRFNGTLETYYTRAGGVVDGIESQTHVTFDFKAESHGAATPVARQRVREILMDKGSATLIGKVFFIPPPIEVGAVD